MADYIHIEIDAADVLAELTRLSSPPAEAYAKLEGILLSSFAATQAHVHVITGFLKASGHPSSEVSGDEWSGTLSYARYPGIYELARGDKPTQNHPEGGHFFFDPPEGDDAYRHMYEQVMLDWLGATGHGFPG